MVDVVKKKENNATADRTKTNKRRLSTTSVLSSTKKPSLDQPQETHSTTDEDGIINIPKELIITLEEIGSSNPPQMKVNKYIKLILSEWETAITTTSESDKLLIKETKKALFHILVKLRKGIVPSDQFTSLLTIFYYVQRESFMKANESYMKLSIGNVAWPIGVVNVSIHARSAQTKTNDGGANIMIDEVTRKWITGIKRLISFKEKSSSQ